MVKLVTDTNLTAAVNAAVANLVAGAPGALDTLNELATALGDDANFAVTVTTALGNRLVWRGVWAPATNYVTNDLVTFNSGLYRAPNSFTSGGAFVLANWVELHPQIGTYAPSSSATVSVLQYGAVGGNEALDTAAFVAAIAAAGTYGTVLVPWAASKLPYIVTPATLELLDGTNLVAQGWRVKVQKGTGVGSVVHALGKTAPRIAGLCFFGAATQSTGRVTNDFGVEISGCIDPVVEDCEIYGMGWDALAFDAWANLRPVIRRNFIHDSANHGLTCTSAKGYNGNTQTTTDAQIIDNLILNVGNFGLIAGYNRTPGGGTIAIGTDATLVTVNVGTTANLVSTDVGLTVEIPGAGAAGATLVTTIASVVDDHTFHITTPASTSVSGVQITIDSFGVRYKVRGNTVVNSLGPGIQFFTLDGLSAAHNVMDGCPTWLISAVRHSVVDTPVIRNAAPTTTYNGALYINLCDDLTVNDADIYNVTNAGGGAGEGIRFISNGLLGQPIYCNRPKVKALANHGIEVLAADVYIDEHSVEGAGTLGSAGWGILLNACTRPHVTRGRRTEGNVSGGISASGAVINPRVSKNEVTNVAAVGANPPAFNISGTSTGGHWLDNDIHDNGTGARYSGTGGSGTVIRDDIQEGSLPVKAVAGVVSDASFVGGITPISGALAVDTINSQLYVRVGATWKKVAVA